MRARRRESVTELGRLQVLLGNDRTGYVRWTSAPVGEGAVVPDIDPGRLATVAAVDWAVRASLTTSGFTTAEVDALLTGACAARTAGEYAERRALDAVVVDAPPPGTLGGAVHVDVSAPPQAAFRLRWGVPATPTDMTTLKAARQVLAATWWLADQHGHGDAVHHALFTLRGGFGQAGPFAPDLAEQLVTSLLTFGTDMADSDARAQEARARLRIVRD